MKNKRGVSGELGLTSAGDAPLGDPANHARVGVRDGRGKSGLTSAGDAPLGAPPSFARMGAERRGRTRRELSLNGPTILTLIRIILVLPLVALMFVPGPAPRALAIVCFVAASATDFVDGRWARRTHQVTDLGAFLDPLADKMLINLTFLVLVYQNIVPLWMFALILVRDFAVDGMRMMSAKNGVTISASIFGKAKTMTQMFTIILLMLNTIIASPVLAVINTVLLYIVLALTIFSGADYLIKGAKLLKK